MVKQHGRKRRKATNTRRFLKDSVSHLLEVGTLESMQNAKQVTAELLKYQWMYYAELARQRSLIKESIA